MLSKAEQKVSSSPGKKTRKIAASNIITVRRPTPNVTVRTKRGSSAFRSDSALYRSCEADISVVIQPSVDLRSRRASSFGKIARSAYQRPTADELWTSSKYGTKLVLSMVSFVTSSSSRFLSRISSRRPILDSASMKMMVAPRNVNKSDALAALDASISWSLVRTATYSLPQVCSAVPPSRVVVCASSDA